MSLLQAPNATSAPAPSVRPELFRCTQCGNCCKELFVAVTHRDLQRLQDATQTPASSMVTWLPPGAVEIASAAGQFLSTADGLRLMVLAHEAGACRFLSADKRCSVHEHRPLDCQQFPLHVSHRGKVEFLTEARPMPALRLRVLGNVQCEAEEGELSLVDQATGIEAQRAEEVLEYAQLVAEWNRRSRWLERLRNKKPDLRELFGFLGLR